ncbi:hypothetical protein BST97_06185 [Nonlabens spongiae]|uniref:Uncharacterized protein n=1 Tax=Nonlabens spongiae TaxID=331648 RepID=A0A1W6MJ16_9FLAO|nr:hypothetical protein [Nonlabens spongiae]ARN77614.1 hypothetical protein BST97_06185 [Nonlabens spongiae]
MASNPRRRNPILGLIFGIVFVGFGSYRLYNHFIVGEEMPTWRLILSFAFLGYGLFVLASLVMNRNGK